MAGRPDLLVLVLVVPTVATMSQEGYRWYPHSDWCVAGRQCERDGMFGVLGQHIDIISVTLIMM